MGGSSEKIALHLPTILHFPVEIIATKMARAAAEVSVI
jgi:hypothetical protein